MDQSLVGTDRPMGDSQIVVLPGQQTQEHPALNWFKLIFLVLITYGLMASMAFICIAIETMYNNSVPSSYMSGGGLLFGLFCFYVICFGVAWCWGSGKRDQMRRQVVEQQIARQKAMEALMQME